MYAPIEGETAVLPSENIKDMAKLYGDTMGGDVLRLSKQGEAENVDVWDPSLVVFPPLSE